MWKFRWEMLAATMVGAAGLLAGSADSQTGRPGPGFAADGTVHVPAFDLPPSPLISKEALELQKSRATMVMPQGVPGSGSKLDITMVRKGMEGHLVAQVNDMRARYPVDIVEQRIAGVRTRIVTPKGKAFDPKRVLINVHGGGFSMCAEACAMLESVPISSVGGFKVVTVDYRMGPEAVFPAASEDVAAVYRQLLKTYRPRQIGIYGCSAGGALSGEMGAWLPAHGLPQAGALGIFGAGAVHMGGGDSGYVAGYIDGSFAPPPPAGAPRPPAAFRDYFEGTPNDDPMAWPATHLDVMAKFPPTLVITGTRAMDMSPAAFTHSQLVKAGVPGDLIVQEGMSHCYIYMPQLPEARDAYQTIVRFFRAHLG